MGVISHFRISAAITQNCTWRRLIERPHALVHAPIRTAGHPPRGLALTRGVMQPEQLPHPPHCASAPAGLSRDLCCHRVTRPRRKSPRQRIEGALDLDRFYTRRRLH
jgi:hypothetical protein